METNRDEAERCIEIAVQAFKEYKTQRATNFLKKAEKLYPSQKAKDLLAEVSEFDKVQQIYRVLRCRNHYEVLEVSRDATYNDIKVAYKRVALLVHPDKHSKANRLIAEQAVKKLNNAKDVLTNPFERSSYNLTMNEDTVHEPFEGNDPPESEDDVNDNEANSENDDSIPEYRKWWETMNGQFILAAHPIILLILIPAAILCLSAGIVWANKPPQIFSLTRNEYFSVRRRTMGKKIPYYVTTNYYEELRDFYEGSLTMLEKEVKLAYACEKEKDYKKSEMDAAINSPYRNAPNWEDWYKRTKSIETPSCSNLEILSKSRTKIFNIFRIFAFNY